MVVITLLNYLMDKTLPDFTVNPVTLLSKLWDTLLPLFNKVANLQNYFKPLLREVCLNYIHVFSY